MEKIYEEATIEMIEKGWEERVSVVSDDLLRVVWVKKGDVGEWFSMMEYDKERGDDRVLCMMELVIGKRFVTKLKAEKKLLCPAGIEAIMNTLRKGIIDVLEKELKGGYVCQNLSVKSVFV